MPQKQLAESQSDPSDPDDSSVRLHHIDAVHFVHHAIKHALRDTDLMVDGQVTGDGLCRILLELAVDEFGAKGQEILMQWNLVSSVDVGLVVERLREAEVEEAMKVHSELDYRGWFDLDAAQDTWRLSW